MVVSEIPQPELRRLYCVVREDLAPGLRCAQAAHAVAEACLVWERDAWEWNTGGNYLIVLGVPDLATLTHWWNQVVQMEIPAQVFEEPDLGGEATAFAALPPPEMNLEFRDLPLAFQPPLSRARRGLLALQNRWLLR
jgi:peptidyl-tRNA hydrolase